MADEDIPASAQDSAAMAAALAPRFRARLLQYFSRRVRPPEDAEELVQEVFVRLLRRERLADIQNVEGFIFATAANLVRDHYRGAARRGAQVAMDDVVPPIADERENVARATEDRERLGVLLQAVKALPEKCRAAFVMHRFEDLPHGEIARRMGISVSAVEKHIASAVAALRERLGRGGDD